MSYLVSFCYCVFSVLLALRLPRLGKRELILVLFVRLFDLFLFVAFPGLFSYPFLSVSSSSWYLGRAAVCDCGTPWTFLLPFLEHLTTKEYRSIPATRPIILSNHLIMKRILLPLGEAAQTAFKSVAWYVMDGWFHSAIRVSSVNIGNHSFPLPHGCDLWIDK